MAMQACVIAVARNCIAVGPRQGRKVFTLQTLPDERDADETLATTAGNVGGFSHWCAVIREST